MIFCGVSLTLGLGNFAEEDAARSANGPTPQLPGLAASRMVCSRMVKAGEGAVSVRIVRPTGPLVSSVSTGRATKAPLAISLATTPAEMIHTALLCRMKERPKESETVSISVAGAVMPLVMNRRSTKGRMTDSRRRHQHREFVEPCEDVRSRLEQRMSGPHHEQHLFGIEMLEEEAGHVFGRRQPPDDEIERAGAQLLEQHGVLAGDDLDRRAGIFPLGTGSWPAA